MKMNAVYLVYYSATGNTEKAAKAVAEPIAKAWDLPLHCIDFTLPKAREAVQTFKEGDFVIVATPVYAGRIPNKMLPYIQTNLEGNNALALPLVTFGNRNFDNGLIELVTELENHGFHTVSAAGIPTEHVFSDKLAAGRPNEEDLAALKQFAQKTVEKVDSLSALPSEPVAVRGTFPAPYYTPLGTDGKPAVFLKAKPKTLEDKCNRCGVCADVCPVGSISKENPAEVNGICIKCQACVKKCPEHAKYFDDPAFLSHVAMLEENYAGRSEIELFI